MTLMTNKQSYNIAIQIENMRNLLKQKKITTKEFTDFIDNEMLLHQEWASGIYKDPDTHRICSSKKRSK